MVRQGRARLWLRRGRQAQCLLSVVGMGAVISLAGCGGGSSSDASPGSTGSAKSESSENSPSGSSTLSVRETWDFTSAAVDVSRWALSSESRTYGQAAVTGGALALDARLVASEEDGSVTCPRAQATVSFSDSALVAGSLTHLSLDMAVSRWSLGLGMMDSHVPMLELVYAGKRYTMGISGFRNMPGNLNLDWTAATGLVASYDSLTSAATATVSDDNGAASLTLWTDGCSEGMSQSLRITRLTVRGA